MKKKILVLLLVLPILLTGCGKNETTSEVEEVTTEATTEVVEETTTTEEVEKTTTKKTTTTTKATTAKTTTTTTMAKNMYKKVSDGVWHKYTYVFDDEATCNSKAQGEYGDAAQKSGKVIMFYGCDEVLSQSGETKWGLYYMTSTSSDSIFYW